MTTIAEIQQRSAPSRIGQGTAVEQSRAIAEVEAAIVVALRHPRDIERAVADMLRSCARSSLAEKAFFRFSRGEGPISGPSVQLARELARCWGNFQSGLVELRRDDEYKQSEMQAWAWDVQTNTRTSTTFIVPHIRDTKLGPKPLTDVRDVYENNANMGARRLREMIFDSLPVWFAEDAVAACYRTLAGAEKDLPQRIEKCVSLFAELGIKVPQLANKLGSPADKWSPYDLATLTVIYRSLQRGEIRKEDEFPDASGPVTIAEIAQQPANGAAAPHAAGPAVPQHNHAEGSCPPDCPYRQSVVQSAVDFNLALEAENPDPAGPADTDASSGAATDNAPDRCSSGQRNMITAQFARLGFDAQADAGEILGAATALANRKERIGDLGDLTSDEAGRVRDALKAQNEHDDLLALLVKLGTRAEGAAG